MQEPKIEKKRVFFGAEVTAPWPDRFPSGRILGESSRHMTLAFLGSVPIEPLREALSDLPVPGMQVGPAGYFDRCLLLPPRRSRVLAWRVRLLGGGEAMAGYLRELSGRLRAAGYAIDGREFLPHVTLARAPMAQRQWRRQFHPLPLSIPAIHLYESVGNLVYTPLWSHRLIPPFEGADGPGRGVMRVRGESPGQLEANTRVAMAFRDPGRTLELVEGALPEGAHGRAVKRPDGVLEWELAGCGKRPGPSA